jgi:ribosomal protein S18 acetylase RimI-like enzyme
LCLLDELVDDESGFIHNKATLVEEYKNGNLWGLRVEETDAMFDRQAAIDPLFCPVSLSQLYMLPCFCTVTPTSTVQVIWVHSRARRMGLGSTLIRLLNITNTSGPRLEGSEAFWKACNM